MRVFRSLKSSSQPQVMCKVTHYMPTQHLSAACITIQAEEGDTDAVTNMSMTDPEAVLFLQLQIWCNPLRKH